MSITASNIASALQEAEGKQRAGDLQGAIDLYDRILKQSPRHPVVLFQKAFIAEKVQQLETAETLYRHAINAKEDFAEAHYNLGNILSRSGRKQESVNHFLRASQINDQMAAAHYSLGVVLRDLRRPDEGMNCFLRAAELSPDADTHCNIAVLYHLKGQFNEAYAHYTQAMKYNPDHMDTLNNLGALNGQIGRYDEAEVCYQRVLSLNPQNISAINNLGIFYKSTGRLTKAIECYRQGIEVSANASMYHNLLLAMVYAPDVSPEQLTQTAREFGQRLADGLPRGPHRTIDKDPDRKLRIGYVSPDFRKHAVNYFFEHLLHNHDHNNFEIYAYSNTGGEDDVTQRLRASFDHWRDIRNKDDREAAAMIESDGIDILIDLAGHTGRNRLLVFAYKPAPVQASWVGYPATTGMAAMDYRITDIHAEPPGMTEHLSVEKLWRLPEIFCCFGPQDAAPEVIDHPPFKDNGFITFGSMNNFSKVTDDVLSAWRKIMTRVPQSRLLLEVLGLEGEKHRAEVDARLRAAGIDLDRVILLPRRRENQYVLYNRMDIALDPFPCNGGTTSMDCLWMGVPFVTLAGQHFVSRMGVTILTNAGLPDLVAENLGEYVEKSVALALDHTRLTELRHGLREKVMISRVMDQQRFARHMEDAYRQMWRQYCAEQKESIL